MLALVYCQLCLLIRVYASVYPLQVCRRAGVAGCGGNEVDGQSVIRFTPTSAKDAGLAGEGSMKSKAAARRAGRSSKQDVSCVGRARAATTPSFPAYLAGE